MAVADGRLRDRAGVALVSCSEQQVPLSAHLQETSLRERHVLSQTQEVTNDGSPEKKGSLVRSYFADLACTGNVLRQGTHPHSRSPRYSLCAENPTSIQSNFNGTPIPAGDFIWFSSVIKVQGLHLASLPQYYSNTRRLSLLLLARLSSQVSKTERHSSVQVRHLPPPLLPLLVCG